MRPLALAFPVLAALSGLGVHAQSPATGEIRGTITDGSGSANWTVGFYVTITGPGICRTVTADKNGCFYLALLQPGSWHWEIKRRGEEQPSWKLFKPGDRRVVQTEAGKTTKLEIEVRPIACVDYEYMYPPGYIAPIDFNQPGTGLKLSSETWSHLPIR